MGQEVLVLKMWLEDTANVPYSESTLNLGGRLLMDPLTLSETGLKPAPDVNDVTVKLFD